MANSSTQKVSQKLVQLSKWNYIDEVHRMLDRGDSPNSVCSYINKNGFKISTPMVYEYAKMRKKALVDQLDMEHVLGVARKPLFADESAKTAMSRLKSEIDALDCIIEGGFKTLQEFSNRPIAPKTMMDAISLKAKLTNGNHGFLTNYGMEQLREVEQNKYELIIDHLISYIPEDKQQEAMDKIAIIEDEYYQTTEYYEEYLKALELPEDEYMERLQAYEKKMNEPIENDEVQDFEET